MNAIRLCPVEACGSVIPADALECAVCRACTDCQGDQGATCVCHRQVELLCLDCGAPAWPGDRYCAEHSWNADALAAYAEIKRELAESAALAPPVDEGQA